MSKKQMLKLEWGLYFNYLIHGFSLVIIAQNMANLSHSWQIPVVQIAFIVSGMGIGRLIGYLLTSYLADRLPAQKLIVCAMLCYLGFAWGIIWFQQIAILYILTMLAGLGNSFLDAGTYPTLVTLKQGAGYATILIKGFMAVGEFTLPWLVVFLQWQKWWYGWSFIIMGLLIVVNLGIILTAQFPSENSETDVNYAQNIISLPINKKIILFILLGGYGYASMALMLGFTQWITLYAQQVLHYSSAMSHALMSSYSLGSIVGVITLFMLSKSKIKDRHLLFYFNLVTLVAISILLQTKQFWFLSSVSFLIGFSCANGIMQLGLTLLIKINPAKSGFLTSYYYLFGSLASFSVPLITGRLAQINIHTALCCELFFAGAAVLLSWGISYLERK
ncbi:MFS transporter [Bombilactobacillus thymidiniphilus]|uniref:MFS transporter n=1 Tax=Bombilactobacillus thymidiniphilus TaxID=2923363 RepID=A0ABY4PEL7_9LACO|nr:MFS transporter [Bombilactobacillus thymidiniphilus]UQS83956.1 MFS transporter [Bombilactobacillus thymidiniphilus]